MKSRSFILLLFLVITLQKLNSQDIPPPNPDLAINIYSGQSIVFIFDEISEYKNGIMGGGQSTFVRVLSIGDWEMHFKADQPMFYGTGNPSNTMQLDNVGLVVVSTGINQDDGTNIVNYAQTLPLALESTDVLLLGKGSNTNKGGGLRNSFTFNWEVGTRRGNMNPNRLIDQNIAPDTYNLNIILTLSAVF